MSVPRTATVERSTGETSVRVVLDLDGDHAGGLHDGTRRIAVPDGFLGHMLEALATHGGLGLEVEARGDTHVDLHHTAEDIGIAFGEALVEALGDRRGIVRFATAHAPLDEALARAVVDLSGRGHCTFELPERLEQAWVTASFPLTLVGDVLSAIADRGRLTVHLDLLRGRNPHHVAEAAFKALALALREAVRVRGDQVPSTKGTLTA